MKPVTVIEGPVAALDRANVDTDQIVPKQFLKRIERSGFGEYLFWDWFREPGFPLNRIEFHGARQALHREPAEGEVKEEVEIERDVRRQQEIEEVVGIERECVRVAGQWLPAAIGEVPPRNLTGPKHGRREHLDRIVRREVVAKKEEAERSEQPGYEFLRALHAGAEFWVGRDARLTDELF